VGVKKQKPRWRLRTKATRRQTTAAAAIDRAVIGSIEWAEIDRTEIYRMANRKEILGQLGGSGYR
jgi:hypothetical protein